MDAKVKFSVAQGVCVAKISGVVCSRAMVGVHAELSRALEGTAAVVAADASQAAIAIDQDGMSIAAIATGCAPVASGPACIVLPDDRELLRLFTRWQRAQAANGLTRRVFTRSRIESAMRWAAEEASLTQEALRRGFMPPNWVAHDRRECMRYISQGAHQAKAEAR